MELTSDSAKQFLLSKLTEQAMHDGVVLDEIETRMFLFSESSGIPDFDAQERFDKDYDSKTYESKVTKLVRRSYARDKRTEDGRLSWKAALKALSREDFYGLVMVDQAGIPRRQEGEWQFYLEQLPFDITELVIIALGFLVVFRPEAMRLNPAGLGAVACIPAFCLAGLVYRQSFSEDADRQGTPAVKAP